MTFKPQHQLVLTPKVSSTAKLEVLVMEATQVMSTLMLMNMDCTTHLACSIPHTTFRTNFVNQLMFAVTAKDPLQLKETLAFQTALQLKMLSIT
jgi:hypothetical protein